MMTAPRDIYIVAGLGFGDEGKGTITEFLAHDQKAGCVVRYNGGPQAAHHVVQADNTWHCFSQFGAGMFLPEIQSHLAHSVLVKPSNLLAERDELERKGVSDINSRFTIDPDAFLVTPWHAMVCRMEEASRGSKPHGSVGMGVGKAAFDRKNKNPYALQLKDLADSQSLQTKLVGLWHQAAAQADALIGQTTYREQLREIFDSYRDRTSPQVMCDEYSKIAELLSAHLLKDDLFNNSHSSSAPLILEGAQGVLLDYDRGFFPHVTKTDTTFHSAEAFLQRVSLAEAKIQRVGVLRAYGTRHGAGPFVTELSQAVDSYPESHNKTHRWQGEFRIGCFDMVASRYAVLASGKPDFIALTHLDSVGKQKKFSVCCSYEFQGHSSDAELEKYFELKKKGSQRIVKAIKPLPWTDKSDQSRLTQLLSECTPSSFESFEGWGEMSDPRHLPSEACRFIEFIESHSGVNVPVKILSSGPLLQDKQWIK